MPTNILSIWTLVIASRILSFTKHRGENLRYCLTICPQSMQDFIYGDNSLFAPIYIMFFKI